MAGYCEKTASLEISSLCEAVTFPSLNVPIGEDQHPKNHSLHTYILRMHLKTNTESSCWLAVRAACAACSRGSTQLPSPQISVPYSDSWDFGDLIKGFLLSGEVAF